MFSEIMGDFLSSVARLIQGAALLILPGSVCFLN